MLLQAWKRYTSKHVELWMGKAAWKAIAKCIQYLDVREDIRWHMRKLRSTIIVNVHRLQEVRITCADGSKEKT